MLKKICSSPENNIVARHDQQEILANPKLVQRFSKLANKLRTIAPKSDDFLYFSIIFLKAAESCLLDDNGNIKKTANGENAWGFYDENWAWSGNVQPHRNNNKDIFPESELKKAASSWVGLPLCRDHESSSVDGIRGIILDTHYDEKFKQVIGLCALDKINYPDLARKVETGLVRYGSMGTAVETSICSECGNRATTQKEYCNHILNKTAHGEVNVGLKPIEYSLVVQPAEPGAILLKCIASLQEYKNEFMNYGIDNVDNMLGRLNLKQAEHLEGIMKTACGTGGCSIEERRNIVRSFLENNSLLKNADDEFTDSSEGSRNFAEALKAVSQAANVLGDPAVSAEVKSVINSLISELGTTRTITRPDTSSAPAERFTLQEDIPGREPVLSGGVADYSAVNPRRGAQGEVDTGNLPDFPPDDDILSQVHPTGGEPLTGFASNNPNRNINVKIANQVNNSGDFVDDFSINSIMEDIMNESRLRKRAELRRRNAYMQGGADGAEPNTFKGETYDSKKDKQMQQDGNMGGADGMVPGDKETKEKLSRAKLEERRLKRLAYMQGGADGAEPNTYKSEDYKSVRDSQDKQMQQTGNMGGATGVFPGDAQTKENLHRASLNGSGLDKRGYNGPSLSTRFSVSRNLNGSVNHRGSVFEVFAGKKRVVSATAGDIFGAELADNWNWLKSKEYGKEVCDQIRTFGLDYVSGLLKTAQELPPLPEAGGADMGGELPPLPEAGGELPELDEEGAGEEEGEDQAPAEAIDGRLAEIEQLLDEVRDLVGQLEDERLADVDVNVFTGKDEGGEGEDISAELGALSSHIVTNLKKSYRRLDDAADELSMVAETYDNISKLSASQRGEFVKLASSAIRDADQITGETKGLVRLANSMNLNNAADDLNNAVNDEDAVNYAEDQANEVSDVSDAADELEDAADDKAVDSLVTEAMNLRRARREAILKQAEDRVLSERARKREALLVKDANWLTDMAWTDAVAEKLLDGIDAIVQTAGHPPLTQTQRQRIVKEASSPMSAAKLAAELVGYAFEDLWSKLTTGEATAPHAAHDGVLASMTGQQILKEAGAWQDFTDWGAEKVVEAVRGIVEMAGYTWKSSYEDKLYSECAGTAGGAASCGILFGKLSLMAVGDLMDFISGGVTEPITPHPSLADDGALVDDNVVASLNKTLNVKLAEKRADEERETYRVKLRRAYDVGLEMQRKGLLTTTKTALDRQVDEIMTFDNNAFEAFKRSIGNARSVRNMKIASDLGGVNIGVESDSGAQPAANTSMLSADSLSTMWE